MKIAFAILFVLTACAIFVIQAEHCTAMTGNQTDNRTGYNYYDNSSGEDVTNGGYEEGSARTGAITGTVLSSIGSHAVPNANVALLDEYGNLASVPDNPQLSSNGTGNNGGVYMFYDVPYGSYTVTAEKGGVEFFAVVDLNSGTATANVVLPEYVETEPAYQEALPPGVSPPTPGPLRYFVPITVGKTASPAASEENLPFGLAAIGGICALFLFIRRNGNGKA